MAKFPELHRRTPSPPEPIRSATELVAESGVTEIHGVLNQPSLQKYFEAHQVLPLVNSPLLRERKSQNITVAFVNKTRYEAEGEMVLVPLQLLTLSPGGQEIWLRNCLGFRIETQPFKQLALPAGYDLHWAENHEVATQTPDEESPSEGYIFAITKECFLTLAAPTPTKEKKIHQKPRVGKIPQIEATGIPRKTRLPPHKLKISSAEIIELKGLTGPHRTQQAATYKTYLTAMVNYEGVPNNSAALRHHLEKLNVMPPQTIETSKFRIPESDQELVFSLAGLHEFMASLWAGPFDSLDLKVNFPQLSFSQFAWIYQSLLRIYSQEVLRIPGIPIDPEVTYAQDQFPFFRNSELHRFDAYMDAVRSPRNPQSVFPTDPHQASALEELMAISQYPLFPKPSTIQESYLRAHEWLVAQAAQKPSELKAPNWWQEPEQSEILQSSSSLLTDYWIERAIFEEEALPLTPDIVRDVRMRVLMGGRHDRPYGLSFFAEFDQLHQQHSHQLELEDLKVSAYRFETRGLPPRQSNHIRHQIKAEVEAREQQLWLFLSQIFFTHFVNPKSQQLAAPNQPHLYMTTLKEEKLCRAQPPIATSRRWFEPGSGEAELEALTYHSDQYQEMVFFLSEIIAPFVHMLHAYDFDLEKFEEQLKRG